AMAPTFGSRSMSQANSRASKSMIREMRITSRYARASIQVEQTRTVKEQKQMDKIIKKIKRRIWLRASLLTALALMISGASMRLHADTGSCGGTSITLSFTDVPSSNIFFCSIAAAYFSGLTNGTSGTAYTPGATVTRDQMAAFITRPQDSVLRRSRGRAALNQWAPGSFSAGGMTSV